MGFEEALKDLTDAADLATAKEGVEQMTAENRVVGEAADTVVDLSATGGMRESQIGPLADMLASRLDHYNKTDIKKELRQHFTNDAAGQAFDEVLTDRLQSLEVVYSTDAKQSTVWRWQFTDGVELETTVSKEGGRKHHDWKAFKRDYFDALVATGRGEQLAAPSEDLRDSDAWEAWINDLILRDSKTVKHVGPRTEAVRMLQDYIGRNCAYTDLATVRERQGVWAPADGDAAADGGLAELRVPTDEVKRICDQVGISTRALQVELDARGLTSPAVNGVSGTEYDESVRFAYWALNGEIADPEEIVTETETPAEQVAREEEERQDAERDQLGAVGDSDTSNGPPDINGGDEAEDEGPGTDPGLRDGFGADPDGGDTDE
jgi:hypothetical protein